MCVIWSLPLCITAALTHTRYPIITPTSLAELLLPSSQVWCVLYVYSTFRETICMERCVKSLSFWDTPKALLPLTFFCCFWKCQRKFLLLEYFWVLKSGWQSDENICEVRSCEGWKLNWQFLWISMRENMTINKVAHTTRALRT